MKKASWILLTVAGAALRIADGREAVASGLRGVRGTSAAFAAAYGVLYLAIVLVPYRRGEVWTWWALFAGSLTVLAITLLRLPFLDTTLGVSGAASQFGLTMAGLLLDVRRLKGT